MASQKPTSPADKSAAAPAKKAAPGTRLWGIKNPFIYAGTVVFLVVTIIAFVFFPTSAGVSGSGAMSFGTYAGRPIEYTQNSYMVREVQALSEANPSDPSDPNGQMRSYQIYRGAFERTVIHEAMLDKVTSAGIVMPESVIDDQVAGLARFQENGAFSPRLYRAASSSERLNIRRQIKDDFLVQSFATPVYALKPSSRETDFLKAMAAETRTIEYALFPLSAYPDAEVAAWAQGKATDFQRLKLSRITLAKAADAELARKEVEGGKAFAEVAKAKSTDSWSSQGGDIGLRYKHELASELAVAADADKVAALAKGALSPVLKTQSGTYTFYRLEESPVAPVFADASVLADARSRLMQTERGKVEDWALARAKELAALPAKDFDANAKKVGATVKSAGPFSLDYGILTMNVYGQTAPLFTPVPTQGSPELSTAPYNEKFLTAAFGLAPGALSEPLVLGDNVLLLKMKEAGTKADEGMFSLYYPYWFQTKIDDDLRTTFLASPKLKDHFMDVYLKYFTPKSGS